MSALAVFALAGCAHDVADTKSAKASFPAPIPLANAEDMVVLPGGDWLLASRMSAEDIPSGLFAVRTIDGGIAQLYPQSTNESLTPRNDGETAESGCTRELTSQEYSGHGISFLQTSTRGGLLYVVNHGGRESIEIFEVDVPASGQRRPELTWKDCILAPDGTVGNAVAVAENGRIYATVNPVKDGVPQTGNVQVWNPESGWVKVPGTDIDTPTGLALGTNGRVIYVSSFTDRKLVAVAMDGERERREAKVPFGADNVSIADDGSLLVGGLDGDPTDIMRSCLRSDSPECRFTGYVARIDPQSFEVSCTLELGPTVTTTATQVGKTLWFGSSRAPFIWRSVASALTSCPGRVDVGAYDR